MRNMLLPWVFLISVWSCNINDLIRGSWFFTNVQQVILWNIYGILSLVVIIINYRDSAVSHDITNNQLNNTGGKNGKR